VAQRRFVLVSTLAGSRVRWPGNWFDTPEVNGPVDTFAWCAWRLLGANNRELARSYTAYPDVATCTNAVRLIQSGHGRLEAATRPRLPTGRWYWEAGLDGVPLAVSAHWFRWRRDCEHNFEQFMAAVPESIIDFRERPGLAASARAHSLATSNVRSDSIDIRISAEPRHLDPAAKTSGEPAELPMSELTLPTPQGDSSVSADGVIS
jgi:hypothetical protein